MKHNFNDLPWHDSQLIRILIDRSKDEKVELIIQWPDEYDSGYVSIKFSGCYGFITNMNFGISPPDYILEGECITESNELDELRTKWKKIGLDLSKLNCFVIKTNSTNSTISVFAMDFDLVSCRKDGELENKSF